MKISWSRLFAESNLDDRIPTFDQRNLGVLMFFLLMFSIHDAAVAKETNAPAPGTLLGGRYAITNSTLDGGGGDGIGGTYRLESTIGQADVGNLTSARYRVQGGFWVQQSSTVTTLFSDGFE